MDNLLELLKLFQNNKEPESKPISKELKEQYPYGEFPIRYTKSGQETIRKQSEHRFSYEHDQPNTDTTKSDISLESLLPLIQTMSSGKKDSNNMIGALSSLLFKDNPQIANLLKLFPVKNNVNIKNTDNFPNTNKVQINSLKRIN